MLILLSLLVPAQAADGRTIMYQEEDNDQRFHATPTIVGCVPRNRVLEAAQETFEGADAILQARIDAYEQALIDHADGKITEDELMDALEAINEANSLGVTEAFEMVIGSEECRKDSFKSSDFPEKGSSCDDFNLYHITIDGEIGPIWWTLSNFDVEPSSDAIEGDVRIQAFLDGEVSVWRRAACDPERSGCRQYSCDKGKTRTYDRREILDILTEDTTGIATVTGAFEAQPKLFSVALDMPTDPLNRMRGFFVNGSSVSWDRIDIDLDHYDGDGLFGDRVNDALDTARDEARALLTDIEQEAGWMSLPLAIQTELHTLHQLALPSPFGLRGGPLSVDLRHNYVTSEYVQAAPGGKDPDGEERWRLDYAISIAGRPFLSGPTSPSLLEDTPDADFGIDIPVLHIDELLKVGYDAGTMNARYNEPGSVIGATLPDVRFSPRVDLDLRTVRPPYLVVSSIGPTTTLEIAFPHTFEISDGVNRSLWEGIQYVRVTPYIDPVSAATATSMVVLDVDWTRRRTATARCVSSFPSERGTPGCPKTVATMESQTPPLLLPNDLPITYTFLDQHTAAAPLTYDRPILGDRVELNHWAANQDHLALYFRGPHYIYEE